MVTWRADDGKTALPILQAGNFDFLITDWNMPGMAGIDLIKAVRADPKLAKLPIPRVRNDYSATQYVVGKKLMTNTN